MKRRDFLLMLSRPCRHRLTDGRIRIVMDATIKAIPQKSWDALRIGMEKMGEIPKCEGEE